MEAGAVRLVGTCRERIVAEAGRQVDTLEACEQMSTAHNPYGDGQAAVVRVMEDIRNH